MTIPPIRWSNTRRSLHSSAPSGRTHLAHTGVSVPTVRDQCGSRDADSLGAKPGDSRAMSSEEMTSECKRSCQSATAAAGSTQELAKGRGEVSQEESLSCPHSSSHLLSTCWEGMVAGVEGGNLQDGRGLGWAEKASLYIGDLWPAGGGRRVKNPPKWGCCAPPSVGLI